MKKTFNELKNKIMKYFTLKDLLINNYLKIKWLFLVNFTNILNKNISSKDKDGFELTFEDNFNKINWDLYGDDKWKIGEHWGMFHPGNLTVYYSEPVFENGRTKFISRYNPKEMVNYETGEKHIIPYEVSLLSTAKWFQQKYGRFECRMTLPNGPYNWPAFWLWGADTNYREIDIIEAYGKETGKSTIIQEINLHWERKDIKWTSIGARKRKLGRPENLTNTFYEFATEWSPDRIVVFVNNVKVFQFTNKKILDEFFNGPMWIVINNSMIRNTPLNGEHFYSEFIVDYIRAYQFKK